uniref:Uncharacterized protein n=1 Tax=Haemonchus contortus TaxID=6289 RepID=A0A7I4YSW5_HAECO
MFHSPPSPSHLPPPSRQLFNSPNGPRSCFLFHRSSTGDTDHGSARLGWSSWWLGRSRRLGS